MFVLTMQATAGPAHSNPDGRRYDLLVFARGADEGEAEAVGRRGLELLGWIEAELSRVGEITNPDSLPEDFRDCFVAARATGCAVIVYDHP